MKATRRKMQRKRLLDTLARGELQRLAMNVGLFEKSAVFKLEYTRRFFSLEK